MTKSQLIKRVAKESELTRAQVSDTFDALLAAMEDALLTEGEVQISGFGVFSMQNIEQHTGRNPKTGETITVPQMRKLVFHASKTLKGKLNETR